MLGIKPVVQIDHRLQFIKIEHNLEFKTRIYKVNDELIKADRSDKTGGFIYALFWN